MANYYHEAREQKRQLKVASEGNRRRAERRAELAAVEVSLALFVAEVCDRARFATSVHLGRHTADGVQTLL
jgi:hypothetical protein